MLLMSSTDAPEVHASALLESARAFQEAASQPGSGATAPALLTYLEAAMRALSAGCYQLAGHAAPGIVAARPNPPPARRSANSAHNHLSCEQEVRLVYALHDLAAGFGGCARTCRDAAGTVRPLVPPRVTGGAGDAQLRRFDRHNRPHGLAS
jgi:hypothetical protein